MATADNMCSCVPLVFGWTAKQNLVYEMTVSTCPSVWNAKLTETRIFRELSIKIESSLIELKSSLIQLESSLIQLESSLIQLESSLIQLLSSLYMYN